MSRGDEPIAPVVALAAHNNGAPAVRTARQIRARSRHSPAGAFHQVLGRNAPRLRRAIELDRFPW
jgi:hypothetical protein